MGAICPSLSDITFRKQPAWPMTKVRRACGRVEEGGAQVPILWALEHDPGMTNYAVPFQIAALGGGPFETMRRATLDLVTSTVSSFLHGDSTDRAHLGYMGCAHPGRQTDDDYDNFVVTNWKDNAHIVHQHSSASAPSSVERRDGAHILSSWTAQEGSDVSCSTAQEEENIPSSLEPTPLVPGAPPAKPWVSTVP